MMSENYMTFKFRYPYKVLLEDSHVYLFMYCLQLHLQYNGRVKQLYQKLYGLCSLKYLLSIPLEKMFAFRLYTTLKKSYYGFHTDYCNIIADAIKKIFFLICNFLRTISQHCIYSISYFIINSLNTNPGTAPTDRLKIRTIFPSICINSSCLQHSMMEISLKSEICFYGDLISSCTNNFIDASTSNNFIKIILINKWSFMLLPFSSWFMTPYFNVIYFNPGIYF